MPPFWLSYGVHHVELGGVFFSLDGEFLQHGLRGVSSCAFCLTEGDQHNQRSQGETRGEGSEGGRALMVFEPLDPTDLGVNINLCSWGWITYTIVVPFVFK
jgi:hypothetical protein